MWNVRILDRHCQTSEIKIKEKNLWNALKITDRSQSTAEKHSFAEMDAIIHVYISLKTSVQVFKRKAFCAYNMAYMMQLIDVIETQL